MPMPTRVIDISSKDGVISPKLFVTGGTLGNWVALSHCWGGDISQSTTTKNLAARQHELPLFDLPRNFQDSIAITIWLGYGYLWIDSLCILQDSETDWAAESSQMTSVYKHATITLAAECASSVDSGILHPRTSDDDAIPIAYQSYSRNLSGWFYIRQIEGLELDARTPLESRGWTLQEFILSPRTLHFDQNQLRWTCQTARFSENRPENSPVLPGSMQVGDLKRLFLCPPKPKNPWLFNFLSLDCLTFDPLLRWYNILHEYGNRQLTKDKDKFPAISGIARETHRLTGLTYRAGLWEEDMHRGLLWSACGGAERSMRSSSPSWSWGSMRFDLPQIYRIGRLFDLMQSKHDGHDAQIEACHISLEGADQYGQVQSGRLMITGLCQSITSLSMISKPHLLLPGLSHGYWKLELGGERPFSLLHTLCDIDDFALRCRDLNLGLSLDYQEREGNGLWAEHYPQYSFDQLRIPPEAIYLQIAKWSGKYADPEGTIYSLVLEPTGEDGVYRRIGRAQIPQQDGIAKIGWKVETVVII
jgi:hypothetical protein